MGASEIQFHVSSEEFELIDAIARRAHGIAVRARIARPGEDFLQQIRMDLTAAHANGCPLRLASLLEAPAGDFAHDVFGIRRHLDRTTAQVGGCFLPRFAARPGSA